MCTDCIACLQSWSYAALAVKIPLVMLAAVPLVAILGVTYHKATGTPLEMSMLKVDITKHAGATAAAVGVCATEV